MFLNYVSNNMKGKCNVEVKLGKKLPLLRGKDKDTTTEWGKHVSKLTNTFWTF